MIRYVTIPCTIAALLVPPHAIAQLTYQNDSLEDEGAGVVVCGFAVDEKFAAVFVPDPSDYPFVIEEVQFMLTAYTQEGSECVAVTEGTATVAVEIWNDDSPAVDPPRPPVYSATEWSVTTSSTSLNSLAIGESEEIRVESGVVRVAVTITSEEMSPVRDDDGIVNERNLIFLDSGSWSWAEDQGVTGDWLLRLVVMSEGLPEPDGSEPAPDASDDALEDPADVEEDVAEDPREDDPSEEPSEGRLGGGGCSCAQAQPDVPGAALLFLLALPLLAMRVGRR